MPKSAFHLQALVFSLGSMDAFIYGAGFPYRIFSVLSLFLQYFSAADLTKTNERAHKLNN